MNSIKMDFDSFTSIDKMILKYLKRIETANLVEDIKFREVAKSKQFNYKELPKIISIMVCKFDLFKKGKPIYEIIRSVKDCNIVADNGIRELYVNLTSKEVKETKLNDLFKMFTDYDYENESEFPNLTELKKEINGKLKGGYPMTGISREIFMDGKAMGIAEGKAVGIAEGMEKGIANMRALLIELYNNNAITKEYAAKKLNITEDEFLSLIK